MTINSLTSLMTGQKSLVDYLNTNNSTSSWYTKGTGSTTNNASLVDTLNGDDSGDTVSLSAQARQLLAQAQSKNTTSTTSTATAASTATSKALTGAKNFLTQFFTDSGIDLSKASDETVSLIKGIQKVINDSGATAQDTTIDGMTAKASHGNRKSFTIAGTDQRISLTVTYAQGKPTKMTVTESVNGKTTTAAITVKSTNGTPSTIDVDRMQKAYNRFGGMIGSSKSALLTLDVYAKS